MPINKQSALCNHSFHYSIYFHREVFSQNVFMFKVKSSFHNTDGRFAWHYLEPLIYEPVTKGGDVATCFSIIEINIYYQLCSMCILCIVFTIQ